MGRVSDDQLKEMIREEETIRDTSPMIFLPETIGAFLDLRELRKLARDLVDRLDWISRSPNLQDKTLKEISGLYGNELPALLAALEEK